MANDRKTHSVTVLENQSSVARERADTYLAMIAQADLAEARGDANVAAQARSNAAEYADTRMGERAKRLAGL